MTPDALLADAGRLKKALHPEEYLSVLHPAGGSPLQRQLRVTVVLRYGNRRLLNLPQLHRCLLYQILGSSSSSYSVSAAEKLAAVQWVHMEALTFDEQRLLMQQTDLLIAVHGSVFINAALFMGVPAVALHPPRRSPSLAAAAPAAPAAPSGDDGARADAGGEQLLSASIALMQSRHIEFALPQVGHRHLPRCVISMLRFLVLLLMMLSILLLLTRLPTSLTLPLSGVVCLSYVHAEGRTAEWRSPTPHCPCAAPRSE